MAEVGAVVFHIAIDGQPRDVKIAALGEEWIEVDLPPERPQRITFRLAGEAYEVLQRDGKPCLPARLLWRWRRADFPVVGYALDTACWRDPIAFLREHQADSRPAPLTFAR